MLDTRKKINVIPNKTKATKEEWGENRGVSKMADEGGGLVKRNEEMHCHATKSAAAPRMLCIPQGYWILTANLRASLCHCGLGVSGVSGVGKTLPVSVVSPSRKNIGGTCYGIAVWKGKGSWLFYIILVISLSSSSLFPQDDTVLLSNLRV